MEYGAIILDHNIEMLVGLPCRNFDKLEAIFTGVIQHVAHHFDKIILLTNKADFWRDIEEILTPLR